jgi:hypothetical protein
MAYHLSKTAVRGRPGSAITAPRGGCRDLSAAGGPHGRELSREPPRVDVGSIHKVDTKYRSAMERRKNPAMRCTVHLANHDTRSGTRLRRMCGGISGWPQEEFCTSPCGQESMSVIPKQRNGYLCARHVPGCLTADEGDLVNPRTCAS